MRRISKWLVVLICCLPAAALAQARKEVAKESKNVQSAPAPIPAVPTRTTANFGDWILRCETVAAQPKRVCEVAHAIAVAGQSAPIAQIAIGKQLPNEAEQLTVVVPPNIAISVKPLVAIAKTGAAPIELTWQRCLPGACFASTTISNAAIGELAAQTEPGRIVFKNSAENEIVLPLSFLGLSQAIAALAKE